MNRQAASAAPASSASAETTTRETHLHGWRLIAARAGWVLVAAWILANFVRSLPAQLYTFQHPSARSTELAPGAVAALLKVGITLDAYAWTAVGFGSLLMFAATALALVLFLRRGDDWMVLLVSLFFPAYCLLTFGPSESFHAAPSGSPLAVGNTIFLAAVTFAIIYAVFLLFPSGRFVPSWSWVLLVMFIAWVAAFTAAPTVSVLYAGYPIFLGAAIACQVHRYRKVSTLAQRTQTRWAVLGLVTALLANQAFWFTSGLPALDKTVYPPVAYLVLYCSVLLIPVAFFIAIQRYQLFEIDTLINRALVYGTLTAMLAGIYFAGVLGMQAVTQHLTGQTGQQPIVIVVTTLLIAVLFTPLRRRIQAGIDRAFYRSKYDAAQTLAAFGERLRTETDLDNLRVHVVEVVQQTMQPSHVTLWLRPPSQHNVETSTGESTPPR